MEGQAEPRNPARSGLPRRPLAQTVATEVRDQYILGLSVGFVPEQSRWTFIADHEWDPDNGRVDHVTRTRARLVEVSLTRTPAHAGAW